MLRDSRVKTIDPESVKMTNLKGSLAFFKAVGRYSQKISRSGMSFRSLAFRGEPFFKSEDIEKIYYSFNDNYSLNQRLEATKQALLRKVSGRISSEMKKDWVDIAIQNLQADELESLLGDPDKRQYESEKKERNELARIIVRNALKPIIRRIRHGIFMNPNKLFLGFLKTLPRLIDRSKAEVGSSNNITSGFMAKARAIATRWACPPERDFGKAEIFSVKPTFSSRLSVFFRASDSFHLPSFIGAREIFCSTFKCGKRLKD